MSNPEVDNPNTADMMGLSMGFVITIMLVSAMAVVVLLPKKFCNQ